MQDQIKTIIKFGGFYNSIHSSIIDNDIDSYIEYMNDENDTELEEYDYNFNYHDMKMQYLKQYISDYIDFIEYLKDHTKSYDGFWSHYTYETALNNKDDILTLYIFEYIANKYQKSDRFNIDIHVDINENTPELIT